MLDQLPALLGVDLSDLAGAHASGEIPLSAPLVNRLIAVRLAESRTPVTALTIEPRHGNLILVHVRLRTAFVPPLTMQLRIDEQPRFPDSPVLVARWSLTGLGALARLASPMLAILDLLPPGVSMNGDRIAIDLAAVLTAKGHGEVVPLLRHLEVLATEGYLVVRFEVRVEDSRAD